MPQSLAHVAWNTVCDMQMVLKIRIFSESMTLKIKCVYTGPPALDSGYGEVNFGRGDRDGASHRLRTMPNAGEEVASAQDEQTLVEYPWRRHVRMLPGESRMKIHGKHPQQMPLRWNEAACRNHWRMWHGTLFATCRWY